MRSADSGQAARDDLATLGNKLREQAHVLVVDVLDFLDAELANLLAAEILAAAFAGATRSATRARAPGRWTLAMSFGCCRRFGRGSRCFRFVSHDAPSLCGTDAVVRRLRFQLWGGHSCPPTSRSRRSLAKLLRPLPRAPGPQTP